MPQIPLYVLDSVVYLYPSAEAAEAGEGIGGTGFLLSHPLDGYDERGPNALYVVTNAHVIHAGRARFVRLNTHDGYTDVIEPTRWVTHPDGDDLAVSPIGLSADHHRFIGVPSSQCLAGPEDTVTRVTSHNVPIGPGEDVFFVGRFIGHDGRQRNQPTARFGHVALELTTIRSEAGVDQESYLVEARSLSGYSGSPVFVYRMPYGAILGDDKLPGGGLQDIRNHKLLGVDWCHLRDFRPVLRADKKTPATDGDDKPMYVEQNSGMLGVVPSWKLMEILNESELVTLRNELSDSLKEGTDHVSEDVLTNADSEYDRFKALARHLVKTPKPEKEDAP